MTSTLGQLTNAPLIYVLAQIVFTRIPKMESYWEDFHQAIFDRYPLASVDHIRQVQLGNESVSSTPDLVRWNMLDREKGTGVILAPESLTFHATSYTNSKDFFERLEFILEKLAGILPKNITINRLGLRYIDLLLPSEQLPVDSLVSGKLGSISLEEANCKFLKLEEVTSYKTPENGNLVIRHRQSTGPDILPSDLFPINLRNAQLLEKSKPENTVVGLMDYDHYVQLEDNFEPTAIISKFNAIHTTSSKAFKLTTTPEARQLWGETK